MNAWKRRSSAGFDDARRRIGPFIGYQNFQRPHSGIGGMVPADRFFAAATAGAGDAEGARRKETRPNSRARHAAQAPST